MNYNASSFISLLVISLSLSTSATEEKQASFDFAAEKAITAVKNGEPFRMVEVPLEVTDNSLQLLESYRKDPSRDVRDAALAIYFKIGIRSSDLDLRQRTVDNLVAGLSDTSTLVREHILNNLQKFSPEDFSLDAKKRLMNAIRTKPDYNVILAVGLANIQEALPILAEIRTNEVERIEQLMAHQKVGSDLYQKRWDVSSLYRGSLLASGRMGKTNAIEEYIHRVENLKELSTRLHFVKMLQYVQQPEVITYLQKYLHSDEYIGGEEDVVKLYVASIAADMLSQMVGGFPSRQTGEREEDYIVRGREWTRKTLIIPVLGPVP